MWVAQVHVWDEFAGKSKPVRRYAKTREGARAKLKELKSGAASSRRDPRAGTLADYLRLWNQRSLPRLELSPNTREQYRDSIERYAIPAAGEIGLCGLSPSLCEEWLARIAETRKVQRTPGGEQARTGPPIAASTVRGTYNAVVRALDTAVRDDLLPENPLRRIERPRNPRVEVPYAKPSDVQATLKAVQGRRVEALYAFVVFTGVRIGEALEIRWEDLDLDRGQAVIRRGTPTRATTKTGRMRSVTLVPPVVDQLKRRRAEQARERLAAGPVWCGDADGLVFTTGLGKRLSRHNVTHELQRAQRQAGVPTARPWHSLRHAFAHQCLQGGIPMPVVSALLGHSGIGITNDIYGHVDSVVPAEVLLRALEGGQSHPSEAL